MGSCGTVTIKTTAPISTDTCPSGQSPCEVSTDSRKCLEDGFYWDCLNGCWVQSETSCGSTTGGLKTCDPACTNGYVCNTVEGVCISTGIENGGDGTGGGGDGTGTGSAGTCVQLNRDGEFDITCIMEKQNQTLLILGIALLAGVIVMR